MLQSLKVRARHLRLYAGLYQICIYCTYGVCHHLCLFMWAAGSH